MPTSFPTGLDSFTNPASTDDVSVVSHNDQHANANDAIEALEAKVGINSSADTSSIDYILTNLASLVSSITIDSLLPSQTGQSGNFLTTDGTSASWGAAGGGSGADPTASVGLTAVNGSATTFLRSDGAPALDVSIAPTWTGQHILANAATIFGAGDNTGSLTGATLRGPNASGSNVAGVDTIIQGSLATGNATSGSLLFKTGAIGSSGSTSQTATPALTLDGSQNATFGGQIIMESSGSSDFRGMYSDANQLYGVVISGGGGPSIRLVFGNSGCVYDYTSWRQVYDNLCSLGTASLRWSALYTCQANLVAGATTQIPCVIQGAASQTAPLLQLQGVSSTAAVRAMAEVDAVWDDNTDATRSADLVLRAYYTNSALEGVRVRGTSGGAAIAFLGGTPAVQQANASQTAITAVLDANAKSALQAIYDLLVAYNLAPATA